MRCDAARAERCGGRHGLRLSRVEDHGNTRPENAPAEVPPTTAPAANLARMAVSVGVPRRTYTIRT